MEGNSHNPFGKEGRVLVATSLKDLDPQNTAKFCNKSAYPICLICNAYHMISVPSSPCPPLSGPLTYSARVRKHLILATVAAAATCSASGVGLSGGEE